jgi:acid phosphatase (class A)
MIMARYSAPFVAAFLILAFFSGSTTSAQTFVQDRTMAQADRGGYLDQAHQIDPVKFLPAPPAPGSAAFEADKYAFEFTRTLKDSERWKLAANDDKLDLDSIASNFSCALGFTLERKSAPRLYALLKKVGADAGSAIGAGKTFFARPRPVMGNSEPICVSDRSGYEHSYSYPSGHSTLSWTYTLILVELVPDRAGEIAARGRAFGESRVVCGVHWPSDVVAGRETASTVFAALNGNQAFRADMEKARLEIAGLRRTAPRPDPASCSIPNAAAAKQPW